MKRFIHSITLDSGKVAGALFAPIEADDLPDSGVVAGQYALATVKVDQKGRVVEIAAGAVPPLAIGSAVTGARNNGSALYVSPAGLLADEESGYFAWDTDGTFAGGVAKKATLYVGDSTAAGDGGRLALRDPVNGHWMTINYRLGVLRLTSLGANVSAAFDSVTATGTISSDGVISGNDGMFVVGLVDILSKPSGVGLNITANATTPDDLARFNDNSSVLGSRFNKDGYFVTAKVAAPADGDLANSELAFWLDDTPGAAKAKFKAKNSAGTVVTGSVNLT